MLCFAFLIINQLPYKMTSTILYRGYTVTSSLGERNIFLKFVDQVSFTNYEATLEQKDFRLQHDLPTIYKVMMDTFTEKDENFNLDISILSGFMKLNFHALVGGFLNLQFEVVLREKVVATEVLYSSKMEQTLRELEEKVAQQNLTIQHLNTTSKEMQYKLNEQLNELGGTVAWQSSKLLEMEEKLSEIEMNSKKMEGNSKKMEKKLDVLLKQSVALLNAEINIMERHSSIQPLYVRMGTKELQIEGDRGAIDLRKLSLILHLQKVTFRCHNPNACIIVSGEALRHQNLEELCIQGGDWRHLDLSICVLPNLKRITFKAASVENGTRQHIISFCKDNNINLII
jgi:uncharacterized coiled-coil protein SlyX